MSAGVILTVRVRRRKPRQKEFARSTAVSRYMRCQRPPFDVTVRQNAVTR